MGPSGAFYKDQKSSVGFIRMRIMGFTAHHPCQWIKWVGLSLCIHAPSIVKSIRFIDFILFEKIQTKKVLDLDCVRVWEREDQLLISTTQRSCFLVIKGRKKGFWFALHPSITLILLSSRLWLVIFVFFLFFVFLLWGVHSFQIFYYYWFDLYRFYMKLITNLLIVSVGWVFYFYFEKFNMF
jgi:hypothetical protein